MSASSLPVVVGVDVGGTNTDAVVISKVKGQGHQVLSEDKHLTTSDVTTGVRNAVLTVLRQAKKERGGITVTQVNIGTTHFVNAVVQHKHVSRVSVIRLCGPASRAAPPFSDFPPSLKNVIFGSAHFVKGGFRVDGREIEKIDPEEIKAVVEEIKGKGVKNIVVCSIFAPTRIQQEEEAEKLIGEVYPEATVTLSHTIGHIGLLERENAAILNEALKNLCRRTVSGFRQALQEIGTNCPMFLTQNDGTVISEQQALAAPVFTFASGPTNSMRGAAFLCQVTDAVVVDIGGTTTDVGVLKKHFPRQASTDVRVGGVRTNFRMPDVHSVGLGGGSYVNKTAEGKTAVGPLSAGYRLKQEALVFGTEVENADPQSGRRLTTTDVAVAAGLMELGDKALVAHLSQEDITAAMSRIQHIVEDAIDRVRISGEPLPVILVGGGSKLLDWTKVKLKGVSEVLLPEHFGVANAIGAALSQVSGNVDSVIPLENLVDHGQMAQLEQQAKNDLPPGASQEEIDKAVSAVRKPFLEAARDQAMSDMCQKARQMALQAGADGSTLQIVEQEDVALSYLPGSATRIKVKAVGDLLEPSGPDSQLSPWTEPEGLVIKDPDVSTDVAKQTRSVTGRSFNTSELETDADVTWAGLTPSRPYVDPDSGEWILSAWDVECIAVGVGLLGAGGGGNPNVGRVRARAAVERGEKIRIISPERLLGPNPSDDDLLMCVAFLGAPVVLYEQTTSGQETIQAFRCLQDVYSIGGFANGDLTNKEGVEIKEKDGVVYIDDYQPVKTEAQQQAEAEDKWRFGKRRMVGMVCAEIGGLNSIEPLLVSAALGLPTLDADGMGRAFPMLQMWLPYIHGVNPYPLTMADDQGRRAVILRTKTARQSEDHLRGVSMQMGSAAGLAMDVIPGSVVKKSIIYRSMSRVWTIGDCVLRARREKRDPLKALMAVEDAKVLITGKISDVSRETSGAFNLGRVRIEGVACCPSGLEAREQANDELLRILIDFQNENLVVRVLDENDVPQQMLAIVPDVIIIVDAETAEPIPTEEVRYGQRVSVLVMAVPPEMTTPRALEEVGPGVFGYHDLPYEPQVQYKEPEALAPK